MKIDDQENAIARRVSTLTAQGRRGFLARLYASGLGLSEVPITEAPRNGALPVSFAQARQWFLWQLNKQSRAYHISSAMRLQGALDAEALRWTFQALTDRHESLRTVFRASADGLIEQVVQSTGQPGFASIDLSDLPSQEREKKAAEEARRTCQAAFDLTSGQLFRVGLIKLSAGEHILVVVMHHIVSDGWSMQILIDEFVELYRAKVEGRTPNLKPMPIQYADYAVWQKNWLEAGEQERQLTYWRGQLGQEQPLLQMPADHPRAADPKYSAGHHSFVLPAALTAGLQRRAKEHGATLFMVLLAGFQALLHRYTGQRDIRVGITNANRHRPETQGVVGLFVNTQVLRSEVEGRLTLSALLDEVRDAVMGAQEHQDLPFEQLVEDLQPERSLSHSPLFQVMMNHQRRDIRGLSQLPGLTLRDYPLGEQQAPFELTLRTAEQADGTVAATLVHAVELFDADTLARWEQHLVEVLRAIADRPEQTVGEISLRSETKTEADAPVATTCERGFEPAHRRIARRAAQCAEQPALHCEGRTLTHGELDRWSDRIALRLRTLGVKAESRVGLCVERSVGMVAGLLGILKSGGAFVPLDPAYPAERLSYMIDDAQLHAVLTDGISAAQCGSVLIGRPQIRVDHLDASIDDKAAPLPEIPIGPDQLAYVIYTSGSTGAPKGVAISHRSLSLHLDDFIECYGISETDKMLHSSTINFDVALHELLPALMMGGQVQMRGPKLWELDTLTRTLREEQVSFARIPTAYWQQWLRAVPQELPRLRQITVGGEGLPGDALARWLNGPLKAIPVDNLYGPTETTVACLAHRCTVADAEHHTVPIGRPYASRKARVIDADGNAVPIGGLGELCISGETLARGYLDRPGLTAERFIADPASGQGARLYRTGDLCRQRADGVVEFLGRLDQQVKLRGHRIELGEVEVALRRCAGVNEAVVDLRGEGERRRLIGYVVGSAEPAALRAHLAERLPDYMVPSAVVVLPKLPVSATGKLDRKALPEPEYVGTGTFEAPQGAIEESLASIWADLLKVERVGRHDNFFELGGDSILSLQIVARAQSAGWKLTPRQMFERQTIAQLAGVAEPVNAAVPSVEESVSGSVPLLPIQAWFFEQAIPNRHHWNQSVLLRSDGPLDAEQLEQALAAVVAHHDVFRLRYNAEGKQTFAEKNQVLAGGKQAFAEAAVEPDVLWRRDAADAQEIIAICAEAQRSLNLEAGPLLRAVLITVADGSYRLLLVIHHLIVDGVSWRVLLEDLQVTPTRKSTSYQRWAQRLQAWGEDIADQLPYWQRLADVPTSLPCDDVEGGNLLRDETSLSLRLDRERTRALLKDVPAAYRTQINDVLLTALGRALCVWSGHERILIDLEGHGREDLFDGVDLSRTVGWFTSLYPVAIDANGDLGTALKRVKETLRQVPTGGLGYGVLRKSLPSMASSQVVVNYLGQFDSSFDANALWKPASESSGPSRDLNAPRGHEFSINGQIYDGELRLTVNYSAQRHRRESVQTWIDVFQRELEALIAHCISGVKGLTPSDFPLAKLTQSQLDTLPVPIEQVEDLYPMTPLQQGLLFHALQDPQAHAYINQLRVDIDGLDVERFRAAWQAVFVRHEILRTGFLNSGELSLQWVARSVALPFIEEDWSDVRDMVNALDARAEAERALGFDFVTPPLARLLLIRVSETRHHFIWTRHHLLTDGWSIAQLIGEVLHHYNRQALAPMRGRYRDYIQWRQGRDAKDSEAYWRAQLQRLDEPTQLMSALPVPVNAEGYADFTQTLDVERTQRLIELTRQERVTLNTLVQAAWALLLNRYTGQSSVTFGATTAGRPAELPGVEQLVGLFINTFPVIATPRPEQAIGDWLRELQAQNIASREHEHTALYEIQRWAGSGGQGLFDTLLVFENYPVDEVLRQPGDQRLVFANLSSDSGNHYPLTLRVLLKGQSTLVIDYLHDRARVDDTTVQSIARQFDGLLGELVEQVRRKPDMPLGELRLPDVTPALEGARVSFQGGTVMHVWRESVRLNANERAVHAEGASMTFSALDVASDRLAQALLAKGIGAEVRVGIHAERSIEFVIGVLGVMKAGGVYVPLDPQMPAERLAYQLRDSGARALLSDAKVEWAGDVPVLALSMPERVATPRALPVLPVVHPSQSAYVIYTSGSTGQPKGVVVSHGALVNYVQGVLAQLALPDTARSMAMVSTVAADLGHTVLFGALCSGRTLHLIPAERAFDPDRFAQYLCEHQVSVLKIVPSHLQALLSAARAEDVLPAHTLVLGGEATRWGLLDQLRELKPGLRVLNHYGPTETTVGVLTQEALNASRDSGTLPIGLPLPNSQAHVLDAYLNPVPQGVAGELYIGGAGVAQGYHGKSGLTAERFVASAFRDGERLYRTGDRVRQLADGSLEYLGRTDDQVKVRGYRVELREVANALKRLAGVREAEVIVRTGEDGRMQLHGYVTAEAAATLDGGSLREQLTTILPEYMVPSAIVPLDRLPLTANGKVDRKALPEPGAPATATHEAPQSETEQILAKIWSELLGVERVGRNDNFFALGGDSILTLKVIARARQRSLVVAPKQVFQHQTLSALAAAIDANDSSKENESIIPSLSVVDRTTPLALSPAQSRQWFLWQLDKESTAYHVARALRLHGQVSLDALKSTFQTLWNRHESLRTVFRTSSEGVAEHVIQPPGELNIALLDLSNLPADIREATAANEARQITRTPFDLTAGPLFRAGLIRLSADEHILTVVMHHVVSDGWSMQIIVDEFVELYRATVEGREPALQELPIQYADYAAWQRNWLEAGEQERQLAYWRRQLGDEHPALQLPTDHPRQVNAKYRAAHHTFELPASITEGLHKRAREHRATLFTLLLAGFQALLHRYTGQQDVRVGVTQANRNRPETQRVVGFFVNTQVMRSQVEGGMTLQSLLEQVREAVAGAQEHQDLPFEQLVEALQPERNMGQPLFQVMMDHQRKDYRSLGSLPGLTLQRYALAEQGALFELWMNTTEQADGRVSVRLSYAKELFDPATIERFGQHYQNVLAAIASQPQQSVAGVALLEDTERNQLLRWGARDQDYPAAEAIHRLIERRAQTNAEATALVFGDTRVSYGELNRRANQLAHRLVALGVKPETRVGLAMERSIEMIVGLLAILKAGGAYVPLDPAYPADRLSYMLKDSGIELLLTQKSVVELLPSAPDITVLQVDALDGASESKNDPRVSVHPDNLAYVIYTSGSTGTPKGAQLSHRNVVRLLEATQEWFHFDDRDVWTLFHSFAFDFSVWEIFGALCYGGRLVVVPHDVSRSPEEFLNLLRQQQVTVLNQTPSAFRQLMQVPSLQNDADLALRAVIFGGEALDPRTLRPWIERFGDARPRLINMYGITETTVHVTYRPVTREDLDAPRSPIGRNIRDLTIRVLDSQLNVAPIGVPGELYVAGSGLARGYLKRAGLTGERFVADPLSGEGDRLYRTGDLVRWNASGQLEYLGRIDQQVKIRGFRIELGEIEAQLRAQPEVREAVVLAREVEGDKRLIAYVVPDAQAFDPEHVGPEGSRGQVVTQWESVFDTAYESAATAPSFRGWNSSYTDQPIPEPEMREWLQVTIERIRALSPHSVLEIGCGVGLLVRELAPEAHDYVGTDLSPRAVRDLRAWLAKQPALSHVEIRQGEANNFSGMARNQFDTIVLNSVAQYFPEVGYLLEVLKGASGVISPKGCLFVGDIRHLAHLPMFHTSVQLAKASSALTVRQLKSRIRRAIEQDKELVLDPAFFRAIVPHLRMSDVQVSLKRGRADNELTRYRYDVVLRSEARDRPEPEPFSWTGTDSLEKLADHLTSHRPVAACLRGVPNARLARDLAAWRLVESIDERATVAEVLSRLERVELSGVDPEAVYALGDALGYVVNVTWAEGTTDGSLDIELVERTHVGSAIAERDQQVKPPRHWRSLASNPLRSLYMQRLGVSLREQLLGKLPDYMVPAQIVVLEALPLTRNGKLDHKALPVPEFAASQSYESPEGPVEEALAGIWAEVLGIDRIGRHDNFFELGGHSLAAMKVVALVRSRLLVALPLRDLFETPTVSGLARARSALFLESQDAGRKLMELDELLKEAEG